MLTGMDVLTLRFLGWPKYKKEIQNLVLANPSLAADPAALFILAQEKIDQKISAQQFQQAREQAAKTIAQAQKENMAILVPFDPNFPQQLLSIDPPPILLFVKGNANALAAQKTVAVVGTREPSEFGRNAAHRLGGYFAQQKFTVVSGLALGCDTAAHSSCLENKGITIAVLAHGLDTIYPAVNKKLAQQIIHSGGCLVSEYLPGTKAEKYYFIERDRIQSGLSQGIVVIESETDGGTMHTARFCQQQKRLLGCVVHPSTTNAQSISGNTKLLRDGAKAIKDDQDLMHFIASLPLLKQFAEPEKPQTTSLDIRAFLTPTATAKRSGSDLRTKPAKTAKKEAETTDDKQKFQSFLSQKIDVPVGKNTSQVVDENSQKPSVPLANNIL